MLTKLITGGGGDKDYALIQDFNAAEDTIQLHGSAGNYTQQRQGDDTYLYYQGSSPELVAVLEKSKQCEFQYWIRVCIAI